MVGPSRPSGGATFSSGAAASAPSVEIKTLPSGASYPAFLEPLTPNELSLLDAYDRIRHYEKEAARLKAEEAKRRLEEADERYKAKQRTRDGGGSDGDDDDAQSASDEDKEAASKHQRTNHYDSDAERRRDDSGDDEEDKEVAERRRKRDKEISRMRRDVDAQNQKEAKRAAAREREEAMRRELLGEDARAPAREREERKRPPDGDGDDDDEDSDIYSDSDEEHQPHASISGPSIKKKRMEHVNPWDEKPKTSLLVNIAGDSTPVHDFSKKLGMSKAGLDGSILFPDEGNMPWRPPEGPSDSFDGCLELELSDFDPSAGGGSGNNTVAVKFHASKESKRFSINIAAPDHNDYNDILFHFNPRHFQRGGQLVINNRKESMWGNDISVPLSTLPLMFGEQSCTLIVQINEEGFDVFVEGQHCARLEHRSILPQGKGSLLLQFPSSDDYGNPENWMVYRVWWGRKASMAAADLSGVAGVNIYSAVHPKKLFVSGLAKLRSDPEVDLRRAELERAFRKYGGPSGAVLVSVQKNSTFAFVEVASEQQAELALREMTGRYKVNRARRTKHEALLEERAAKEAEEKGVAPGAGMKESIDWD